MSYLKACRQLVSHSIDYRYAVELLEHNNDPEEYKVKSVYYTNDYKEAKDSVHFFMMMYHRIRIIDIDSDQIMFEWSIKYGPHGNKNMWYRKRYSGNLSEYRLNEGHRIHDLVFIKERKSTWKIIYDKNGVRKEIGMIRYCPKDHTCPTYICIDKTYMEDIFKFRDRLEKCYHRNKKRMHIVNKPHNKWHKVRYGR